MQNSSFQQSCASEQFDAGEQERMQKSNAEGSYEATSFSLLSLVLTSVLAPCWPFCFVSSSRPMNVHDGDAVPFCVLLRDPLALCHLMAY